MHTTRQRVRDGLPPTTEQIYLLTGDENKTAKLFLLLTDANYAVQLLTEPRDLSIALSEQPSPAAIIVHASFAGNNSSLVAAIAKLKQDIPAPPPLIFISSEDSIACRLAAVRAGGQHFLTEPVDHRSLFSALDNLLAHTAKSASYKVLVVDDAPAQLHYYNEILSDDRLSLRTLSQPLEIVSTLNHFQPDVIVIRLSMSDCSGLELGQIIRQYKPSEHTPVIYLYTNADEHLHIEAMNVGGDAFFDKAMQPEHLVEAIITKAIIAKAQQTHSEQQLDPQVQDRLDRSEFYNFAMDQHNIVSITDIDGRITNVNERFCTISGYRREELIGHNHRLIKSSHHDKAFYQDIWQTISSGKVWHGEICNLTKAGHEYWVNSTIVPFLNRKGTPWQYISVRTDITALHLSEERLHRSQNFANIGTWDWNICTDELHWSERIGPLFGYPEGVRETSFENFKAAIHPEDLPVVLHAIEDCIERGLDYNLEHRTVWPDGSVHWAQESGNAIRNTSGDAIRMLGVVQDITQRKTIELGLLEEQRRLEQAQKMGAIGDWWLDQSDNQPHYSGEALRIMGQVAVDAQLTLEQILEKIEPEDRKAIASDTRKVIRQGHSKIDLRISLDHNNLRWVQMARHAIHDKTGKVTGFRGTVQDITEGKQAEQQQQHSNRILENIAKDAPLADTLALLISQAETVQADRYGAVLIVDPATGLLSFEAAPSLPNTLSVAVNVLNVDARQVLNSQSIVDDIANHANWQGLRETSARAGFYIC